MNIDGYDYEDELDVEEITMGMYLASIVDGVRVYPFRWENGKKVYIEKLSI